MKKTGILFAAAVCALIFAVCASAAVLGDVDGDGGVTASDARLALRAAVGLEETILPETEVFAAADADFNGKITADDARSILRAAVGLEDLADRLPESEAMTEDALREKLQACTLTVSVDYQKGRGSLAPGFVIDENGTVVVPYRLIHKATKIIVEGRGDCRVEQVLWADPASGLALLKVSGELPYLSVNRTWFDIGDPVYSTDYMLGLHRLAIAVPPSDPEAEIPENAVCASVPEGEYMFDLKFYPMVDRFGRAIGMILLDEHTENGRFAAAAPLSLLPSPEEYAPRTVEEFARDEWRISLESPVESLELVQYGTCVVPLYAENLSTETIQVINPREELLDVSVEPYSSGDLFLIILAKQTCTDIPVTVCVKGMYETAEITFTVSVAADGYVNMVGAEFLPDPGVVWGMLPTELNVGASVEFTFMKNNTDLTDEELFYSYTYFLEQMGYQYLRTEELEMVNMYYFRLEEFRATVVYTDGPAAVSILCYYAE